MPMKLFIKPDYDVVNYILVLQNTDIYNKHMTLLYHLPEITHSAYDIQENALIRGITFCLNKPSSTLITLRAN